MLRLCRTVFCLSLISVMAPALWADEENPCSSTTCKIEVEINECEWNAFFEAEENIEPSSSVDRPAEVLAWLPSAQVVEPVPPAPVVRREGRGPRDREENGDDRRIGPPDGRRDGFGGGNQPQVPEEKLMEFLEKHEPKLAERLKGLKESEQRQYRRQMGALGRLYGAVISQMERDPEMGELELKRIRLQLKIKDRQRDYRRADDKDAKKEAKDELKKYVAELFDVILAQEDHRYEWFAERLKDFDSSGSQSDRGRPDQPGPPPPGDGDQPGPPRDEDANREGGPRSGSGGRGEGFGRWRRPSPEQRQKYLEDYKETIESWKKHRNKIIDRYVDELLMEERQFPWPR